MQVQKFQVKSKVSVKSSSQVYGVKSTVYSCQVYDVKSMEYSLRVSSPSYVYGVKSSLALQSRPARFGYLRGQTGKALTFWGGDVLVRKT